MSLLPRREDMFWADATGPDGFTLDGASYTGQAVANGANVAEGDKVLVARTCHGLTPGRRRQMVILQSRHGGSKKGMSRDFFARVQQFALWPQSGGNPYNANGPLEETVSPSWGGIEYNFVGSGAEIPRFYWDDQLQFTVQSGSEPQHQNLLSFEGVTLLLAHPSTGKGRVACLATLYDNTGSSIAGYLIREYEISYTEGSGYSFPFPLTGEWIRVCTTPLGTQPTNGSNLTRRNRCLWYDKASDTYTAATHEGLLLCKRENEPTPGAIDWTHTYGSMPGNSGCNMVGRFLIAGAFQGADGTPGDCAINLYQRNDDEHAHVAELALGGQLSGCSHVDSFGYWDPFGDNNLNRTWPYLDGEWYVWISGREGDPGPGSRPTAAKAKLLAIRAAVGTVRVVYEMDAPLETLVAFDDSYSAFVAELTYKSTPHPENWLETGIPSNAYRDAGGPNEWSVGTILSSILTGTLMVNGTIPASDIPEGYGGSDPDSFRGYTQEVDVFTGWDYDGDPGTAPESPRLAAPVTVDSQNKRIYVAVTQQSWVARANPGYYITSGQSYGGFNDFPRNWIPGNAYQHRIWKLVRTISGRFIWDGLITRLWLRVFSSNSLLVERDLTREYVEVDGSGKTIRTRRYPVIYQMAVLGDHLWVLCGDWWSKSNQKLTLLLLDRNSLAEVDRIDLSPDEELERLWQIRDNYEPMLVGVDEVGPWVQVGAWWSGSPDTWIVQEVRYSSGEFARLIRTEVTGENDGPTTARSWLNLAVSPGREFWLRTSGTQTLFLMRSTL